MLDDVMAPLWQRGGVKNWLIRREKSRQNGDNVRDTSLFCPQPGAKAPPSSKDAHQKPLKDCGAARTRIIWGLRGDHSPHRSHRPTAPTARDAALMMKVTLEATSLLMKNASQRHRKEQQNGCMAARLLFTDARLLSASSVMEELEARGGAGKRGEAG